jgi:methyl-accepting chemotaxis protein
MPIWSGWERRKNLGVEIGLKGVRNMRGKLLVIIMLSFLAIGNSSVLAQEQTIKGQETHEGRMMWSAMVGAGFLHDHMKSMIQQMSGMMGMMSKMIESGKMNTEHMKNMSEMMQEMSAMMHEIPGILDMMEKRPDTAMKDMSEMTNTMSELMKKMGETMEKMQN